jgi:competence protein ComEC
MMWQRKFFFATVLALSAMSMTLGAVMISQWQAWSSTKVVFLDVGQGDAILVCEGSNQFLIDGGRSGKILLEQVGAHMPFWDRQIEVVVATHPDEDHIGGLIDLAKTYRIGVFLETKATSDNGSFDALQKVLQERGIETQETTDGLSVKFPDGSVFETLYPFESYENARVKDTNATSIVMKLTTASGRIFLFTGDLPSDKETLLNPGTIDVLKVGHHGSKYSSSQGFLEKITPKDAVFSVGADNRYGHPSPEVLDRLQRQGVTIYRTDKQGTIEYLCPPEKDSDCIVSTSKE